MLVVLDILNDERYITTQQEKNSRSINIKQFIGIIKIQITRGLIYISIIRIYCIFKTRFNL